LSQLISELQLESSLNHSITQSLNHSITQSLNHSITQLLQSLPTVSRATVVRPTHASHRCSQRKSRALRHLALTS
jgi:hypothetical protein